MRETEREREHASLGLKRIRNELKNHKNEKTLTIRFRTCGSDDDHLGHLTGRDDDHLAHLIGTIVGPTGSPYEGGIFELDILVPYDYPFRPPKVKFITNIWHPNVNSITGETCPNPPNVWEPGITLEKLLLCIQALLSDPEPAYSLDDSVTEQFMDDYAGYVEKARIWTRAFAKKEPSFSSEKNKSSLIRKVFKFIKMVTRRR